MTEGEGVARGHGIMFPFELSLLVVSNIAPVLGNRRSTGWTFSMVVDVNTFVALFPFLGPKTGTLGFVTGSGVIPIPFIPHPNNLIHHTNFPEPCSTLAELLHSRMESSSSTFENPLLPRFHLETSSQERVG